MLALGDALAFTLSDARQFTAAEFARFHPAGTLGRKLATVEVYMRRGDELRLAPADATVRAVFASVRHSGRRTGAVMLVDAGGQLAGLFTDSDLARLFETNGDFDRSISEVMTANPLTVARTLKMGDALELMQARKFSELPVVDEEGRPVGLLDITDLLGLPPQPAGPQLARRGGASRDRRTCRATSADPTVNFGCRWRLDRWINHLRQLRRGVENLPRP